MLWRQISPRLKSIHGSKSSLRLKIPVPKSSVWALTLSRKIIARIQTPHANIRRNIHSLLTAVGKHHPQALIYPLTVASKSSSITRKKAALSIMARMQEHSPKIVEQARIVSQELIRVAILWHELWHEGLEEASRLYFTEQNPEGMIAVLEPLHQMIEDVRLCPFVSVTSHTFPGPNNCEGEVIRTSLRERASRGTRSLPSIQTHWRN